jgi:serine/threonine protein kinase
VSDFGVSAELQSSLAMCGTFVGTFKYMSPERIQNKPYNFASVSLRPSCSSGCVRLIDGSWLLNRNTYLNPVFFKTRLQISI